jgi:solute carrier family 25 carnitine/acylcarnitine transporter 20/29
VSRQHGNHRIKKASFDTIKVRLQTSDHARFKGPLDCLTQTLRKEGVRGLYKGATPPLVGWMFMDSLYARPSVRAT